MDKKNKLATRDAYGEVLVELGSIDEHVVVLDADLSGSTRTAFFSKAFPERFFNMGIAEQDMIGTAAGLACAGKKVFASSFAMFVSGRPWEMIRNSVAYPKLNVNIVASHAGITVGEDGASHQALEDIAIMRAIPNLNVIVPADYYEVKEIIKYAAKIDEPFYIRFSRSATPVVFNENYSFDPNAYPVLAEGKDVALLACGIMVAPALEAAEILAKENISAKVININSIKPVHIEQIVKIAKETKAFVTAEEHSIVGGMGSAIAEVLSQFFPVPMEFVGVKDTFGESGSPDDLIQKYKLTPKDIIEAVKKVIKRK
ncbi:transketolase family protein [Candidatus Margulisiibacteriota bacterium]